MNQLVRSIKYFFSCVSTYNTFKFVKGNRIKRNRRKKIYIFEAYTVTCFCVLIPLMLAAKGMQEKTGYKVMQVSEKKKRILGALAMAFGFSRKKMLHMDIKTLNRFLKRKKMTQYIINNLNGETLEKFVYKECLVGPQIYDAILANTERCTIEKLDKKTDWDTIYSSLKIIDEMEEHFKKNPPAYALVPETSYTSGLFLQIAKKYGADIVTDEGLHFITFSEKDEIENCCSSEYCRRDILRLTSEIDMADYRSKVDKHFSALFTGKSEISWENTAFSGKKVGKEDCIKALEINRDNPTVFIMSHCMSDAPHAQRFMVYRDYYIWLKRTIEIVSEIKGVNWIVKPHPHRQFYRGEKDIALYLVEEYGKGNVAVYPDEFSASIVYEMADCIVTAAGTSGIEYITRGIPSVICGTPWYSENGLTIAPQNEEEYIDVLRNISKIEKISKEKRDYANLLFAAFLEFAKGEEKEDQTSWIFSEAYENIRGSDMKLDDINEYVLNKMRDTFNIGNIRENYYYKKGLMFSEKK